MTKMHPNKHKILESILFLIKQAESARSYVTQYEIVKSIFIADTNHLQKYGRPITFDNYAAMKNGPVPIEAYDMLKPNYDGNKVGEKEWPLWECVPSPENGPTVNRFGKLKREPNLRALSETDRAELCDALNLVKKLGFGETRDFTHMNPAYKAAWKDKGDKKSYPMDYSKLLSSPMNADTVEDLSHASKFI
jgi:hypothetical protein